ncbi:ImmA/IrrE family metallo-endopeptidase [Nocardioides aurantiacus]|uniref:Uncharacterized protein DUF955 n=1 Tax=Nocardioides aurantiacus TaxID=86796 RepID=A0A3N2CTS9_9ACTN|nr:ImmA/IrrE family metallo-endopeptidase [Nocardioides aurantiacus]ROR90939.1 uncharacterized protein DUF955 [Nocardioides aurantiacus]
MTRVDSAARELLETHGVSGPPVDVYELARQLEVAVVETTMGKDVSGMLIRDHGALTVGLNKRQVDKRKRFTLAHELGHLVLHRGRPLIVDSSIRYNLRDSTSATATNREEIEANRFAAALLMPEDAVRKAVQATQATTPEELQRKLGRIFEVSTEAMGYRLMNLGITT